MKNFITLTLSVLHMISGIAAVFSQETPVDEVTATITATTSEKELEDLVAFLEDHKLHLKIKQQQRNTQGAITGLNITLEHERQLKQYTVSSNLPIADLELGAKDGALFINTSGTSKANSPLPNAVSGTMPSSTIDNLMQQFGFDIDMVFGLNTPASAVFSHGRFDLDKITTEMIKIWEAQLNPKNGLFPVQSKGKIQSQVSNQSKNKATHQKKAAPENTTSKDLKTKKLIIIDGEESSFKTLRELAKNNQLEAFDSLKPSLAVSIYGEKAKYGAIIATTKK